MKPLQRVPQPVYTRRNNWRALCRVLLCAYRTLWEIIFLIVRLWRHRCSHRKSYTRLYIIWDSNNYTFYTTTFYCNWWLKRIFFYIYKVLVEMNCAKNMFFFFCTLQTITLYLNRKFIFYPTRFELYAPAMHELWKFGIFFFFRLSICIWLFFSSPLHICVFSKEKKTPYTRNPVAV